MLARKERDAILECLTLIGEDVEHVDRGRWAPPKLGSRPCWARKEPPRGKSAITSSAFHRLRALLNSESWLFVRRRCYGG